MKTIQLGTSGLSVPAVAVGCMRMNALSAKEAEAFVAGCLEQGANFFDHADIYGGGACEEIFADAVHMSADVREKLILQSKCGIRPNRYDFSREHLLSAVDGILKRLKTDYLDVLLLHRPDALVEPEEVAEVFNHLLASGKVRNFGVSNHNPGQIQLLQKYVRQPLVANQLQMSITNSSMIQRGINVNIENDSSVDHDGGILDFCRLHDITIQTWSPFQYGFFEGVFLGSEKFPELNKAIDEVAEAHGVSNTVIAAAWILRHPAKMQLISGTMNNKRMSEICAATEVQLTREQWYDIYRAAGNQIP